MQQPRHRPNEQDPHRSITEQVKAGIAAAGRFGPHKETDDDKRKNDRHRGAHGKVAQGQGQVIPLAKPVGENRGCGQDQGQQRRRQYQGKGEYF